MSFDELFLDKEKEESISLPIRTKKEEVVFTYYLSKVNGEVYVDSLIRIISRDLNTNKITKWNPEDIWTQRELKHFYQTPIKKKMMGEQALDLLKSYHYLIDECLLTSWENKEKLSIIYMQLDEILSKMLEPCGLKDIYRFFYKDLALLSEVYNKNK